MNTILIILAVHSFLFAIFHMLFWKALDWKTQLATLNDDNRAVMQILNLRMIYLFIAVGVICLVYQEDLLNSRLGTAFLVVVSGFWIGRIIEDFLFAKLTHPFSPFGIGLLLMFVAGAVLPILPLL